MRALAIVVVLSLAGCTSAPLTPRRPPSSLSSARPPPQLELIAGPEVEPEVEDREPSSEPRQHPPPPLFGGTLLVTRDGELAVASDPERDAVWVTELSPLSIRRRIALTALDEPGASVESADGRVHVILRRGGALVSFDPRGHESPDRRAVCPAPRGIAAHDAELTVACAGGELITLPTAGGEPLARRRLPADLRDVGYEPDGSLWVTRFRSAHRLHVRGDRIDETEVPTTNRETVFSRSTQYGAAVAWRTIADASGAQWMLHQRERKTELARVDEYYGEDGGAVFGALTVWEDGVPRSSVFLPPASQVLPLDLAVLDGGWVAIVSGSDGGVDVVRPATGEVAPGPLDEMGGMAVSVVARGGGLVVQYRDPTGIAVFARPGEIGGESLRLGGELAPDRGHALFHMATAGQVACASCHPEGLDDGHVWIFPGVGPRRTQPLAGGVLAAAPYHWSGELETFDSLMRFVFETRMGGDPLSAADVAAIGAWLDRVPDPSAPTVTNPGAVARGRALFHDARVGCARCHAGPRGTDGRSHDVGTGGSFQTPALRGVASRAPYLHDGCAAMLEERFGRCHTRGHGNIAHLDSAQVGDLITYLESI